MVNFGRCDGSTTKIYMVDCVFQIETKHKFETVTYHCRYKCK